VALIREYPSNGFDTKIFNFTGGYKGIVPFDTMAAWKEGFHLCYLHENGSDIIYFKNPCNVQPLKDQVHNLVEGTNVTADKDLVSKHKRMVEGARN
jgi:hypothetical protein